MATEIERKFLLDAPPDWLQDCASVRIEQGYLVIAEACEVRLRKADDRRLLTAKRGHGEVREEAEVDLAADRFDPLWPLTAGQRLQKTRYQVPLEEGLEAEIDVYQGGLEGLITAEVEFGSPAESRDFTPPSWLGEEITGDDRYANQTLVLDGIPAA
jgi:CYTH domain-containing protein